jgi:hypothetical protein
MSNTLTRYKLVFFCPTTSTRSVLDQLFQRYPNELGKIGEYEQCAFICPGTGQFKPLAAANPAIGERSKLEFVQEDRVELVVNDNGEKVELRKAIEELKKVHPYEEVCHDVYRLEDV